MAGLFISDGGDDFYTFMYESEADAEVNVTAMLLLIVMVVAGT